MRDIMTYFYLPLASLIMPWPLEQSRRLDMAGLCRLAEEIRAEFVKCFHLFFWVVFTCLLVFLLFFSSMAMLNWIIVFVSISFRVFVFLLFYNFCFGLVLVFFSQSARREGRDTRREQGILRGQGIHPSILYLYFRMVL